MRTIERPGFIGRRSQLELFRQLRTSGAFAVAYVHGPGGIGKSALLRRMAAESDGVLVDCATLGDGTEAFERAAADVTGGGSPVLLIDAIDRRPELEPWLRDSFLPGLDDRSLVVVAGRDEPDITWQTSPGWSGVLRVWPLRSLDRRDALELLAASGYPESDREVLVDRVGGHPLALLTAPAMTYPDRDDLRAAAGALWDGVIGTRPTPDHERALEVCAQALATTEDLIRAAAGEPAGELFRWLRRQPWVSARSDGLVPDDVVRQLVEWTATTRDPGRYLAVHRRIRQYLTAEIRSDDPGAVLPAAAALRFLYRSPGTRSEPLVPRAGTVREDPYTPDDRRRLAVIAQRAGGDVLRRAIELWLDGRPEAIRVYRSPTGTVIGALGWIELAAPDPAQTAADPLVALAWSISRAAAPLMAGERIAIAHCLLDSAAAADLPALDDLMRSRLTAEMLRASGLAWVFAAGAGYDAWGPPEPMQPLGRSGAVSIFGHDLRRRPLEKHLDETGARAVMAWPVLPRDGAEDSRPRHTVLERDEFDAAVRQALRSWDRPAALRRNPLADSRLVVERAGSGDRAANVRELLKEGIEALALDPADRRFHRAATAAYLQRTPTQAAAAIRLGLPFGTYRRHLTRAVELLCDHLWQAELFGEGRGEGSS
jgi:hypothetical protein